MLTNFVVLLTATCSKLLPADSGFIFHILYNNDQLYTFYGVNNNWTLSVTTCAIKLPYGSCWVLIYFIFSMSAGSDLTPAEMSGCFFVRQTRMKAGQQREHLPGHAVPSRQESWRANCCTNKDAGEQMLKKKKRRKKRTDSHAALVAREVSLPASHGMASFENIWKQNKGYKIALCVIFFCHTRRLP